MNFFKRYIKIVSTGENMELPDEIAQLEEIGNELSSQIINILCSISNNLNDLDILQHLCKVKINCKPYVTYIEAFGHELTLIIKRKDRVKNDYLGFFYFHRHYKGSAKVDLRIGDMTDVVVCERRLTLTYDDLLDILKQIDNSICKSIRGDYIQLGIPRGPEIDTGRIDLKKRHIDEGQVAIPTNPRMVRFEQ